MTTLKIFCILICAALFSLTAPTKEGGKRSTRRSGTGSKTQSSRRSGGSTRKSPRLNGAPRASTADTASPAKNVVKNEKVDNEAALNLPAVPPAAVLKSEKSIERHRPSQIRVIPIHYKGFTKQELNVLKQYAGTWTWRKQNPLEFIGKYLDLCLNETNGTLSIRSNMIAKRREVPLNRWMDNGTEVVMGYSIWQRIHINIAANNKLEIESETKLRIGAHSQTNRILKRLTRVDFGIIEEMTVDGKPYAEIDYQHDSNRVSVLDENCTILGQENQDQKSS